MKIVTVIVLSCANMCFGQIKSDSAELKKQDVENFGDSVYKPGYKKVIIPTVFIGFGVVSLSSDALKNLNSSTKYEIGEHQPKHITLDNYTQYLPAAMVYGYNLAGIKGKHNLKERTFRSYNDCFFFRPFFIQRISGGEYMDCPFWISHRFFYRCLQNIE